MKIAATVSDATKVKAARLASSAAFWIAIGVLFLQNHNMSLPQTFQLISIYYLAVVALEFPTGVVGDHFGHKVSLVAGYIIAGVALIAMVLGASFGYYLVCLSFAALGISLVSGSDAALLHAVSGNFKADQLQVKFYGTLVNVTATALGSLLALISINLPFILTGVFYVLAAGFVLTVRSPVVKSGQANIFMTAFASLDHIRSKPIILHLLIISASVMAFIVSIKWFFNPLLEQMGIPLAYWGVIMGISLLTPLLGIKLYQRGWRSHIVVAFVAFVLSIIPIGIVQLVAVSIGALWIGGILSGYIDAAVDITLNQTIETTQRASILSLGSLMSRLGAAAYIPVAGLILDTSSFLALMVVTGTALLVVCGYSLSKVRKLQVA